MSIYVYICIHIHIHIYSYMNILPKELAHIVMEAKNEVMDNKDSWGYNSV